MRSLQTASRKQVPLLFLPAPGLLADARHFDRLVPEWPSVNRHLAEAKAKREELVALGVQPTRELLTIPPDPINPAYESNEAITAAEDEFWYWSKELSIWKRFLRWRKLSPRVY